MTTIKSFTSLEQAKELLKILPHQSADMSFNVEKGYEVILHPYMTSPWIGVPCWSLAALLSVLPKEIEIDGQHYAPCLFPVKSKWLLKLWHNSNYTITSPISIFRDNPVDACVNIIVKLNELNLLCKA